jgi:hypothetical protein
VAGEGTDSTTAHIPSVGMSPVAMDQGKDTCRDKEQGQTDGRKKREPYGPMLG